MGIFSVLKLLLAVLNTVDVAMAAFFSLRHILIADMGVLQGSSSLDTHTTALAFGKVVDLRDPEKRRNVGGMPCQLISSKK